MWGDDWFQCCCSKVMMMMMLVILRQLSSNADFQEFVQVSWFCQKVIVLTGFPCIQFSYAFPKFSFLMLDPDCMCKYILDLSFANLQKWEMSPSCIGCVTMNSTQNLCKVCRNEVSPYPPVLSQLEKAKKSSSKHKRVLTNVTLLCQK